MSSRQKVKILSIRERNVTKIIYSYHTHAQGIDKGWWGEATHPTHFDEDWNEIKGTTWTIKVSDQEDLEEARRTLISKCLEKGYILHQHPDMGHDG